MKAMVFEGVGRPLKEMTLPIPIPNTHQVQIRVLACGVCRTDLHILDGELEHPKLPLILGHQVVGDILENSDRFKKGDRVGVPWLGRTCGTCLYCKTGHENLCDAPTFTGYTQNGGYGEICVADEEFVFSLPKNRDPASLAPLLCAGMIGYRCYRMAGNVKTTGFYGFGAAARLLLQVALHDGRDVYAFTREGDMKTQEEALRLGAKWAGDSTGLPPCLLDAAILFAPVGELVPLALKALRKGGKVVCGGIHMSKIPAFPYELLWEERSIQSVANLTREDGEIFLKLAQEIPVKPSYKTYPLHQANQALRDLREGTLSGTAVLIPS